MSNNSENLVQKKSKIPYIFFAFFAVVISVNSYYIYISQKSWRGVVTENSYQKGLKYNETIKEASKQQQLGWKLDVKQNRIDDFTIELFLDLRDKNSVKISDAAIEILFKRPAQDGYDFKVKANADKQSGLYLLKANFPFIGQWDAEITIRKDDQISIFNQRLLLE